MTASRAIVFDTFINPKHDQTYVSEIMHAVLRTRPLSRRYWGMSGH